MKSDQFIDAVKELILSMNVATSAPSNRGRAAMHAMDAGMQSLGTFLGGGTVKDLRAAERKFRDVLPYLPAADQDRGNALLGTLIITGETLSQTDRERARGHILRLQTAGDAAPGPVAESPFRDMDLASLNVDDIVTVLRRVQAGMRRWTWEERARTRRPAAAPRKWHIDNEYHVQSILWLVLAPLVPGLVDEEYTPAVGPLHSRADLCIPTMGLVIEVKYLRRGAATSRLIQGIAADAGLYLAQGSPYDSVIAFIWDEEGKQEAHDHLVQGLIRVPGVRDVVVVSAPRMMHA